MTPLIRRRSPLPGWRSGRPPWRPGSPRREHHDRVGRRGERLRARQRLGEAHEPGPEAGDADEARKQEHPTRMAAPTQPRPKRRSPCRQGRRPGRLRGPAGVHPLSQRHRLSFSQVVAQGANSCEFLHGRLTRLTPKGDRQPNLMPTRSASGPISLMKHHFYREEQIPFPRSRRRGEYLRPSLSVDSALFGRAKSFCVTRMRHAIDRKRRFTVSRDTRDVE